MNVLIMGAGGFAKEVVDLVRALGHIPVACFQEGGSAPSAGHVLTGLPVVSRLEDVSFDAAAVAVGSPRVRERFMALAGAENCPVLVHPSAVVSESAALGQGVLVMQNSVVNSDSVVETGTIVDVLCYVAHDCRVGAYTHLAPGTMLAGGSSVGKRCETGVNTSVLPSVRLGDDVITGAGAVCTRDVADGLTVVGVPARALGATGD
jgi:sugar O-acyltransferase (sialic acid O-acetyltransferase NeuD family)